MEDNLERHNEPEEIDMICPECESPKMTRWPSANGPDDYFWSYECKVCGATWEG